MALEVICERMPYEKQDSKNKFKGFSNVVTKKQNKTSYDSFFYLNSL
jgi:hypothetical protein